MIKYPMLLKPIPRQMIWGGNRIKEKYNKIGESNNIGESWELSCRPEAESQICNGIYANQKLSEILGCGYTFPLLIKFIDACDKLSVQVHPDDNIKDDNDIPLGKTEMWYIIEADPDAHIIYGLKDSISEREFAKMVKSSNLEIGLKKVPVKAGDCYFIPAGQVHAIGRGILLAEIQQNSDTTYRLYDYDRLDSQGNPRQLHIEQALNVITSFSNEDIDTLRYSEGFSDNCLANCSKFKCLKLSAPICFEESTKFRALLFISGKGSIYHNNTEYPVSGGDCYYIPEGIEITITGNLEFLSAESNQNHRLNRWF